MSTSRLLTYIMGLIVAGSNTYCQTLFSPRALSMSAYLASVNDVRGFDANPAGLAGIRDWDFSTATYTATSGGQKGFVFQGLSFGKRFLDDHAVGIQYSPGSLLEFIVPSTVVLVDSTPVSIDQRLVYDELFSLGYAFRLRDNFSVGLGARLRGEKLTDTEYQLIDRDTASFIAAVEKRREASTWLLDASVLWNPSERLRLALVGRNLVPIGKQLPEELGAYRLSRNVHAEAGMAWSATDNLVVAGVLSTTERAGVGVEATAFHGFSLRAGVYFERSASPVAYAVSGGVGWTFEFLGIDAGYLHCPRRAHERGTVGLTHVEPSQLPTIDLNKFTPDRLSLSVRAMFGAVRDALVRIEAIELFGPIYPATVGALAFRPIGKVRVKNISRKPVHARARFMVEQLMDAPTETERFHLLPGEEVEIPFTALFNERIKGVSAQTIRDGTVFVSASSLDDYDDRLRTRILIQGKHDWDGDVLTLRYFVTPSDPAIMKYSRDVLLEHAVSVNALPQELRAFRKAQILFDAFAARMLYVGDPKQSADYVQYPSETLDIRGGDCDDMTVCYSSLLNSIGVSTAFVDVIPPGRPEQSHIYMLFDTGLDPHYGGAISSNPKRYVIRKNPRGRETIWIPVETTVLRQGFEEAWSAGAQRFFDDAEIGLGLVKGWMRIVDVY